MKNLLSILLTILTLGFAQGSDDVEDAVDGVIEAVGDGLESAAEGIGVGVEAAVEGVEMGVGTAVDVIDELTDNNNHFSKPMQPLEKMAPLEPMAPLAPMAPLEGFQDTTKTVEKEPSPVENIDAQIEELSSDEFTFREDVTVDSGTVSKTNMRIVGGDLIVHGTINGKVSLFGGDAFLKSGSILNGEIITIGGNVYRDPKSTVNGKIIENNLSEGLIYRETDKEDAIQGTTEFDMHRKSDRSRESWIHPERPVFRYNRNEGLIFTPFNEQWDRSSKSDFRLSWSAGVRWRKGFAPDYIGRTTFEKSFFENQNFLLFASLFKESRTDDGYRLPQEENGWANFLARQDFYDRWDESGWETGFGFNIFKNIRIKTRFVSAEQDTLPIWNMTSLFEKKRLLRPTLQLDQKNVNYTEISLMARSQNYTPLSNGAALYIQSEYIQSDGDSSTVFSMDYGKAIRRNLALLVFNWEFSEGLVFRSRFMAGSGGQELSAHRLFNVGGLGSVEAQPYKVQQGNQMALLNLALYLTPEFTDGDWLISFFANGGRAWDDSSWGTGWISDDPKTAISSAGIGIGHGDWHEFDWMINISKPLDHDGPFQTTIRFNHTF